jgi:hypothetical protein
MLIMSASTSKGCHGDRKIGHIAPSCICADKDHGNYLLQEMMLIIVHSFFTPLLFPYFLCYRLSVTGSIVNPSPNFSLVTL